MLRHAQTLIASLLAIFIAFVIAFTSLITLPQSFQTEPLELVILSINETAKGCLAYAIDRKWEYITKEEQTNTEIDTQDIEQKTEKYFIDCIYLTKSYIERLYKVKIDFSISLQSNDNFNYYYISANIIKNEQQIKTKLERKISISINKIEVKEMYPFKTLNINFTTNGFMTSYVKVEVYFIEDNMYKKVFESYFLPDNIIEKYYVVKVGIEPKYLVKNVNQEKKLVFIVRVFDYDGASVWLKEEVTV